MARGRKNQEVNEGDRFTLDLEPDPALGMSAMTAEDEEDHIHDLYLESVETVATIDAIEPDNNEDDDVETDRYRISMHASVSEAAAQQLFAAFVRKGKVRIALLPIEDDDRFSVEA